MLRVKFEDGKAERDARSMCVGELLPHSGVVDKILGEPPLRLTALTLRPHRAAHHIHLQVSHNALLPTKHYVD